MEIKLFTNQSGGIVGSNQCDVNSLSMISLKRKQILFIIGALVLVILLGLILYFKPVTKELTAVLSSKTSLEEFKQEILSIDEKFKDIYKEFKKLLPKYRTDRFLRIKETSQLMKEHPLLAQRLRDLEKQIENLISKFESEILSGLEVDQKDHAQRLISQLKSSAEEMKRLEDGIYADYSKFWPMPGIHLKLALEELENMLRETK